MHGIDARFISAVTLPAVPLDNHIILVGYSESSPTDSSKWLKRFLLNFGHIDHIYFYGKLLLFFSKLVTFGVVVVEGSGKLFVG